ncbi:MAG: hypothetical protein EA398_04500 [Deltaproteobacteria bacterium]|nr:MAG: hypothetical protein EA398_04500 [Deltaproteobacteria bacterium]
MNPALTRLVACTMLVAFANLACYNSYRITPDELERLSSQHIADSATVQGARGNTVQDVEVRGTTPITLRMATGERHPVTPFNFSMSETQFVAPDYDLLLQRDNIESAQVAEFAPGRTAILISGIVLAAVGSFVLLTVLADDEE